MKANHRLTGERKSSQGMAIGLLVAVAVLFGQEAMAMPDTVNLGTTAGFSVLAGAGITITGPTTIVGDIGTFPTTSITGLENLTLDGVNHAGDAVTQQAKDDLVIAYDDAAGRSYDVTYGGGFDLVGLTLTPGVYNASSSLFLSGNLTLDAEGNDDAVWIFQTGSTLITASDSTVSLINGAVACKVFWQVGSSATLGTDSHFEGHILALTDITLTTGATVNGQVLARNGAVTMDTNTIILERCDSTLPVPVPEGGSAILMLGIGIAGLAALRRLFEQASGSRLVKHA